MSRRCRWCFWRRRPESDEEQLQEARAALEEAKQKAPVVAAIVEESRQRRANDQFGERFAQAFYTRRSRPS